MRTHWCEQRQRTRVYQASDMYAEVVAEKYGTRGWNDRLWYNHALALKRVVELAGLDPATATPDDMDKSPVRFACGYCDESRNHVEVFGWIGVASHGSHLSKVYALTPAAAKCVRSVEPRAIAKQVKSHEEWAALGYYCALCDNYYSRRDMKNRDDVLKHLRSESWHGIAEPQEGVHYHHVPLQDEWAYKRNWSVYLHPTKQTGGRSYAAESHRALYFDFEADKPAPKDFKPQAQ